MIENFRRFQAGPDPFGRNWNVEFRWLQTGISIRHADTVDVKFEVSADGEPKQEKVIALRNPELLALAGKANHRLTDAWCMKLAGSHLHHMIVSFEDMDKTLVTVPRADLEAYAAGLTA